MLKRFLCWVGFHKIGPSSFDDLMVCAFCGQHFGLDDNGKVTVVPNPRIANAPTDIQYLLDRNALLEKALEQAERHCGFYLGEDGEVYDYSTKWNEYRKVSGVPELAQYLMEKQ